MSKYSIEPLFPKELKTYSLKDRASKVEVANFGRVWDPDPTFADFVRSLPDVLGGRDFKTFVAAWAVARDRGRARIAGLGAHVIKVGLNPVLIDLMQRGWITGLAVNGAVLIHDFELAYAGRTSEDVEARIRTGEFGMARETAERLHAATAAAREENLGLGEAVGRMLSESDFPFRELSLLSAAYRLNVPVTAHVALGTDTIHVHPQVSGEAIGKASLRDFFLFCRLVQELNGGGVFLNAGSAVILPEVFLKAVAFVRNQGLPLRDFSTAVCDFNRHYRPQQNVTIRPLMEKGRGFYFIGQHELFLPLLAAALKATVGRPQAGSSDSPSSS
jgi:hypothetical protein